MPAGAENINAKATYIMIITEARAACSHCGQPHNVTVYKSINTAEDASLREKVKDGSLFLWECPHCGTRNLARYETLYHDPECRLMIWVIPSGEVSETQMQAISNHTNAMGNYTLRFVSDTGELIEKILINEAGLDDVTIELCKFLLRHELAAKLGAEKAAGLNLHFFRLNDSTSDKFLTFMYPLDGRMTDANVGFNVYEDCTGIIQRNPQIKPGSGFSRIDAAWLSQFFQE